MTLTPIEYNWYNLVVNNHKDIEDVPSRIRENVRKALIEDGYFEVPAE